MHQGKLQGVKEGGGVRLGLSGREQKGRGGRVGLSAAGREPKDGGVVHLRAFQKV